MLKFILGNLSYFAVMALFVFGCVTNEGSLGGKFLLLGFVSCGLGSPAAKITRFGTVDKRYKGKSVIWWQVLVGIVLFVIGGFIINMSE